MTAQTATTTPDFASPKTAGTIPGFKDSRFFKQEQACRAAYVPRPAHLVPSDIDANYESPDKSGVHSFTLSDGQGNGYTMDYDYDRSLHVKIFKEHQQVFAETLPANTFDDVEHIEYMVLTARSVGQAILDDEFDGDTQAAFMDGYATVADRLDMDFELANPNSNEHVVCTLNVVGPDKKHYETMLSFTMPSLDLWTATDHLTLLCL